jgi:hypothetical protein
LTFRKRQPSPCSLSTPLVPHPLGFICCPHVSHVRKC